MCLLSTLTLNRWNNGAPNRQTLPLASQTTGVESCCDCRGTVSLHLLLVLCVSGCVTWRGQSSLRLLACQKGGAVLHRTEWKQWAETEKPWAALSWFYLQSGSVWTASTQHSPPARWIWFRTVANRKWKDVYLGIHCSYTISSQNQLSGAGPFGLMSQIQKQICRQKIITCIRVLRPQIDSSFNC